jgi:hypothetical protein
MCTIQGLGGRTMAKCANNHEQPSNSTACSVCGSAVIDSDQGNVNRSSTEPDNGASSSTVIDLDLLEDPNDETSDSLEDADESGETDEDADSDEDSESYGDEDDSIDDDESDDDELSDDDDDFQFGRTVSQHATDALRQWAVKHNELDDPYVGGLLKAIDRRSDLTMWASLNPLDVLPHPTVTHDAWIRRAATIAISLRNVLIFVPVLLTWLSIGLAVSAYRDYFDSGSSENNEVNFLQFWSDPEKGDLSSFWRIGDVSRHVAILISLIVILTLAHGLLSSRAQAIRNREAVILEKSRLQVALVLANALHGKRQANPESIGEALAEALNDLTQAARDVHEAASKLEETSLGVAALNPHVETLNTNAQEFFDQTGKQMVTSIRELVNSVESLNSSVAGNVSTLFSDAAIAIEEVSKQLAKTNASVEYGTKQLRDDLDAIHSQLLGVIKGARS